MAQQRNFRAGKSEIGKAQKQFRRNKMISEENARYTERVKTLEKKVELLESYRKLGMATRKQYEETGNEIIKELVELEEKLGVKNEISAKDFLYGDGIDKLMKQINDIQFNLKVFDEMFGKPLEDIEVFDKQVHKAINEVENG